MSLQNATLLAGATLSATGGTPKTFALSGLKVENGIQIVDSAESNIMIREAITAKSVPARVDGNGEWTMDKMEVTVTTPKVRANGKQSFPSIRIIGNFDPEMTTAEKLELRLQAAQTLFDTDFSNLWTVGGLS